LAGRLRAGAINGEATLNAQVSWERRTGVNLYALVRPVGQIANWTGQLPPAALMFSAPYDSTGLVPDLARGASQAVQAAANLSLLRDAARQPLARPVVFYFSGGDGIQFLATRQMLMALAEAPANWRDELETLAEKQSAAQRDFDRASALLTHPQDLNPRRDRELIDRIVQIIETDLTLEQDRLFRLRLKPAEELTASRWPRCSSSTIDRSC
jgi:hypothetical protein